MPIGRPISLTPNVATKNISVVATASQTEFTPSGGYRINELAVFRNGVRLVEGRDFTATDGTTVNLISGATVGDIIDFQIFDSFEIKIKLFFSSTIHPPKVDLVNFVFFNRLIKFITFLDLGG